MATQRYLDGGIYYQQQTVSGTGSWTGVPVGYAGYTYAAGGASFRILFPDQGTDGNAYTFQMIAPINAEVVKTYAQVDVGMKACRVFLKGTPGVITATSDEVVAAINLVALGAIGKNRVQFGASLITSAVIPAALAPVNLSGGLDPNLDLSLSSPRFTAPLNANGGLFHFGQSRPWRILGVGGEITGNSKITVQVVNVDRALVLTDAFGAVITEQNLTVAPRRLLSSNLNFPLLPGQAVKITADPAIQGTMFVYAVSQGALDAFVQG
jgi:hypothetical protein